MTSLLIRLYPRRWRARYAEEFASILEERPLGPFDVADILLGALDAHLRPRERGAVTQKGMGLSMSLRIGGAAAIVGAVLFSAGLFVSSLDGGTDQFVGAAMMVASSVAFLLALIGLSSFQARQHPRLIWAAFALPALGTVISSTGLVAMVTIGDRPLIGEVSPWWIWILGVIATVIGSALFALATYYTRALPRAAATSLVAGSVILLAGMLISSMGIVPGMDDLAPWVIIASVSAFSIGWIALGTSAIRLDQPAAAPA